MASQIALAPHSGPLDTPGELAYRYARSGVARSATTRSNYVAPFTLIDWIIRDEDGTILATVDISGAVLVDSLTVTQAINEEPDTCSFTLRPGTLSDFGGVYGTPTVGQEIRISWAPGAVVFHGFIVTTQRDWRALNKQPPWIAVQCQDPMWLFDARMVTYRFPAQSVSTSIAFLVKYFCNHYPTPHPTDFSLDFVQVNMPSIPSVDVVNQRPSTVMRTLLAAVGGGFYIEGFTVHAWANSVSEPNQPNPTPLTVDLKTLHTVRVADDATQVRRRVIVEGRRTSTLIALPQTTAAYGLALGVPVGDASIFPLTDPVKDYLCRVGTQWMLASEPISVTANGAQPPQARTVQTFTPGVQTYLACGPIPMQPPPRGWIRVGNQYSRYQSITGNPLTENFTLNLPASSSAYGVFTAPIPLDELVEWVDCVMEIVPFGLVWGENSSATFTDPLLRAHPTDTPMVGLSVAQIPDALATRPELEGFVQDGRYAFAGAQARADADLDRFQLPQRSVEWSTDDVNALPGRTQAINLSGPSIDPPMTDSVTILRVTLSFPLRTLPIRRACVGGQVKPSTFLDLVVTETN